MSTIPPWAHGPFELIVHAEEHLLNGDDFDRRIALISFDNSIEVAISTYLSLNPIQRGGKPYKKDDVEKWLENYHTKLDFWDKELGDRKLQCELERSYIIWAHDHRNEQYHGGKKGTPEKQVLEIVRKAALWIMSVLYDIPDIENILKETIKAKRPPVPPQADKQYDRAIDSYYGLIEIAGQTYYTSEVLFVLDEVAYRAIGSDLATKQPDGEADQ